MNFRKSWKWLVAFSFLFSVAYSDWFLFFARYYYNKRTGESTWDKPPELMAPIEVSLITDWLLLSYFIVIFFYRLNVPLKFNMSIFHVHIYCVFYFNDFPLLCIIIFACFCLFFYFSVYFGVYGFQRLVLQVLLGATYFGAMICWKIVNCSTQVKKLLVDSIIFHISEFFFFFGLSRLICNRDDGDLCFAHACPCSVLCLSCVGLTRLRVL